VRYLKCFGTVLLLLLFSVGLPAKEMVETEYFQILYDSESAGTAQELVSYADEEYEKICSYLGIEPVLKDIPVALELNTDEENAFQSNYPYTRILVYDQPFPHLSYWDDTLRGIFSHELFHLASLNMKNGFLKAVDAVLGDTYTPIYLVATNSILEGSAVVYESLAGQGRLNSPNQQAKLLQARREGRFPASYLDVTGVRDTNPSGDLTYLFSGMWLRGVRDRYGKEAYNRFLADCNTMLLPVDWPVWFHKEFGIWPQQSWTEFRDGIPDIQLVDACTPLPGPADILFPAGNGHVLTGKSTGGEVYLDGKKLISVNGLAQASARSDGKAVLVTHSYASSQTVKRTMLVENGRSRVLACKHVQEAVFAGNRMVLLTSLAQHETLVFSGEDREIPLPDGLILTNLVGMDENHLAALARTKDEGTSVMILNLEDLSTRSFVFPEGMELTSLSRDGESLIVGWAKQGTLSRLAFLDPKDGSLGLQDEDVDGGARNAVMSGDDCLVQNTFFDHTAVGILNLKRLRFAKSFSTIIRGSLKTKKEGIPLEGTPYSPLRYYRKGTVLPLFSTVRIYHDNLLHLSVSDTAVGVARIMSDPYGALSLVGGIGWNLSGKTWTGVLETSSTHWDLFGQLDYDEGGVESYAGRAIAALSSGTLAASDTIWLFGKRMSDGWHDAFNNTLSVQYSSIRRRDVGLYSSGGFLFRTSLSYDKQKVDDFSWWNLSCTMRFCVPYLLPFHSRNATFNLPLTFTFWLSPSPDIFLSCAASAILFSKEIQRGTPVIHLYFRRMTVECTYQVIWYWDARPAGDFPVFDAHSYMRLPAMNQNHIISLAWYIGTSLNNTALAVANGKLGFLLSYTIGNGNPWSFTVLYNLLPSSFT